MPAALLMGMRLAPQVADAEKEMEFLQAAFNATHRLKRHRPNGPVGHCEVSACRCDASSIRESASSPTTIAGKGSIICVHVCSLFRSLACVLLSRPSTRCHP